MIDKKGIQLRQNYARLARIYKNPRYAQAKQFKRSGRNQRKLKTQLWVVYNDILRKVGEDISKDLRKTLEVSVKILKQKRKDQNKIYSAHQILIPA